MDKLSFASRGFEVTDTAVAQALDRVPQAVMTGFECAATIRSLDGIARRLNLIDPHVKPLAYEGAVAALILRDMLSPLRSRLATRFVSGPAAPYIHMAYIGYGFLLPRMPRQLWQRMLPNFGEPHHSLLSWLAVDGYAFDRAYFDPERWVVRQYLPRAYPWQGDPGYFLRVVDQGVGRALVWIHGADPRAMAATIERFASHRRPDLWSGVAASVTYAPGTGLDAGALKFLLSAANGCAPEVALGAAMAVKARHLAGMVPDHTAMASTVLTGLTVENAVRLVDDAAEEATSGGRGPGYERWRLRIRSRISEYLPVPSGPAD